MSIELKDNQIYNLTNKQMNETGIITMRKSELDDLALLHDKMWETVEPDEIKKIQDEETEIIEYLLEEYYGYVRPQDRNS